MTKLQVKIKSNFENEIFENENTKEDFTEKEELTNKEQTLKGSLLLSAELQDNLNQLVALSANITESYTSIIFLADNSKKVLHPAAIHSLSREINPNVQIPFGAGLVGWTAQNLNRISVCPFENDATTLLYYTKDQTLKSFIAIPIVDKNNSLLGVISCDSKKTYAFSKTTEKLLIDCASQVSSIIALHKKSVSARKSASPADQRDTFKEYLDQLSMQKSEQGLLVKAAELPQELIGRDALVVITVDEPGSSSASINSSSNVQIAGSRLLELVSRHKKVLCRERSVHAVSLEDNQGRSFLSVPFHIFNREAGSLNLLSRQHFAFEAEDIQKIETMAAKLGKELESIRLREKFLAPENATGLLPWENFSTVASKTIKEAVSRRDSLVLVRLAITNINQIEDLLGPTSTRNFIFQLMRLIGQVKGSYSLAGHLYGNQILILASREEAPKLMGRFYRLLEKISIEEVLTAAQSPDSNQSPVQSRMRLNNILSSGLNQVVVQIPQEADNFNEAMFKSNKHLEMAKHNLSKEESINARTW
ncbi:MAG: GAF domain-containing protein [Proteobacteria bacterium]|nr:GAF domain-containing protein [Pseudomonadota bacterium]